MSHTPAYFEQIDELAAAPGTPTQIANPKRATLRTAFAALIGLLVILNPALLVIIEMLHELEPTFTVAPWVFAVLNAVIVLVTAVISGVTRILVLPGVNEWIKKYFPFLAAIPISK